MPENLTDPLPQQPPAVASKDLLEHQWRHPPPGTQIVKTGIVKKGDWFYIQELGAWGLVPKVGWGTPILNSLIARGETVWSAVDTSRCYNAAGERRHD